MRKNALQIGRGVNEYTGVKNFYNQKQNNFFAILTAHPVKKQPENSLPLFNFILCHFVPTQCNCEPETRCSQRTQNELCLEFCTFFLVARVSPPESVI